MDVTIQTDHKWKDFKYRDEVPQDTLVEFDYLNEDGAEYDHFIKYRGSWYHLSDFMLSDAFPGWHAYRGDSFFSGVVIEISKDGERYRIGTYMG